MREHPVGTVILPSDRTLLRKGVFVSAPLQPPSGFGLPGQGTAHSSGTLQSALPCQPSAWLYAALLHARLARTLLAAVSSAKPDPVFSYTLDKRLLPPQITISRTAN
jgi:hypothetical protein